MPTENESTKATDETVENAPAVEEVAEAFNLTDFLSGITDRDEQREAIAYFKAAIKDRFNAIKAKSLVTQDDKDELLEQKEYFSQLKNIEALLNDVQSLSLDLDEDVKEAESVEDDAKESLSVTDTTVDEATDVETVDAVDETATETLSSETSVADETKEDPTVATVTETESQETLSMTNTLPVPPAGMAPAATVAVQDQFSVVASDGAAGFAAGQEINSPKELTQAMLNAYERAGGRRNWNFSSNVTNDFLKVATILDRNDDYVKIVDAGNSHGNRLAIEQAIMQHQESIDRIIDTQGLVASGGICAPASPSYDFFRLAVPQNPVERALPSLRAPRGTIRYIIPPSFRDIKGGISVVTCADDAAGYESTPADCGGPGPTPDKGCVCVKCPDVGECCVTAIAECLRWGNFNYYTFPELVQSFTQDMAVNFAITKETLFMNAIDAASTQVTSGASYGASKDIFWDLQVAAVNYRYRHHMPLNATLEVFLPSWALDAIKIDLANNAYVGSSAMNVSDAEILAAFRSRNLRPTFYYDGVPTTFIPEGPQAAGPLNNLPTQMKSYLFAPGTFVKISTFELDFGIVRDHILNSTNDFTMFMEETANVCKVGFESIAITHDICSSGSGGGAIDPICSQNG